MDFRLDDEQLALQDGVATFCASRFPLDTIADREGVGVDRADWQALGDLGVFSLLVGAEAGGLGLGMVEATLVFEQLGRHLVGGPLVWTTLAATLTTPAPAADRPTSVAPPVVGGHDVTVDGDGPVVVEHAGDLDQLLVLGSDEVTLVERAQLGDPSPLEPLDPLTPVGRIDVVGPGTRLGGPAEADQLRARGTVLTAALLVGIADRGLAVARDYSLEREQFGQPIGAFQALKHLMADMFVRLSLARSATYGAAAVLDDPAAGHEVRSVSGAKLLAGEAAIDNARASVQVLGGMGFTWDMLPNYLLKRAWVLEHGFGTAAAHASSISASLAGELQSR